MDNAVFQARAMQQSNPALRKVFVWHSFAAYAFISSSSSAIASNAATMGDYS